MAILHRANAFRKRRHADLQKQCPIDKVVDAIKYLGSRIALRGGGIGYVCCSAYYGMTKAGETHNPWVSCNMQPKNNQLFYKKTWSQFKPGLHCQVVDKQ